MKMKPLTIVLAGVAGLVGVFLGSRFPIIGLICIIGVLGFVAYVLLSNKQGKLVDPAARTSALAITPTEGFARVYVARRGFMGGLQGMNITIDGDFEGQIRSGFFMMAEVLPGEHNLSARFLAATEGTRLNHPFTVAAGEAVLFEMGFEMGALQGKLRFDEQRDKATIARDINSRKMIDWLRRP